MPDPINIKELIADREAGTPGSWSVSMETSVWGDCKVAKTDELIQADCYRTPTLPEKQANALRIARLPDLEAAYIEAVELLREINEDWRTRQSDNFLWRLDKFLGRTDA